MARSLIFLRWIPNTISRALVRCSELCIDLFRRGDNDKVFLSDKLVFKCRLGFFNRINVISDDEDCDRLFKIKGDCVVLFDDGSLDNRDISKIEIILIFNPET
jgi:hypothetical protein